MTDINPTPSWAAVRQLETNEFASGGANGNMNEQAKSLAARSELLKQYAALPYESKTGGYALNERVQLATGDIVRSTISSNVNNPNIDMTGWVIPYLVKSSNLSDVPDKVVARTNLGVYSQTEVNTAISNSATPAATELVAGKAKIATTAIAQTGTNDADFLTPKKLRDVEKFKSGIAVVLATGVITRSSGCITSCSKSSTGIYNITLSNPSNLQVFATATSNDTNHPAIIFYNSATSITIRTQNSYDSALRDTPFTIDVELR